MTNTEFIDILKYVLRYKTLYVMGCFGAPLKDKKTKQRYIDAYKYNQSDKRMKLINNATPDTYGFDCVGLIKGVLWGWCGSDATYGGAKYKANGVPDIGADAMIKKCKTSDDWSSILPGEAVWKKGHIGVYIGDGLVIESSPAFKDGVQITSIKKRDGYNQRTWTLHGRLPYIEYNNTIKESYAKGSAVQLKHEPLYASATIEKPTINISGTFYIYDGAKIHGRYRITNKRSSCGKKPTAKYVTGFIKR